MTDQQQPDEPYELTLQDQATGVGWLLLEAKQLCVTYAEAAQAVQAHEWATFFNETGADVARVLDEVSVRLSEQMAFKICPPWCRR